MKVLYKKLVGFVRDTLWYFKAQLGRKAVNKMLKNIKYLLCAIALKNGQIKNMLCRALNGQKVCFHNNVNKNCMEKNILLFIFSIFSFCNIGLTEGNERKPLPPFIREALLSECPGRDVDSVNYPVIKGFAILIKNGFSAIGHGVLDIIGVCNNTIKPSNTFNFIARLPLSIKDIIIQNNNNILSNIGVKSLINISDMQLKPGSGFLNNIWFFIERYHITEALYVTSVIGCLFLIKPFLAWNWGLGDPEIIKNKAEKQIFLDALSLRTECEDNILSQKEIYSSLNEHARLLVEAQNIERARLLEEAQNIERARLLEEAQNIERARLLADKAIVDKTIADADRRAQITANVAKARLAESTAARAVGRLSPPPVGGGAVEAKESEAIARGAISVPVVTDNPKVTLNKMVECIGVRVILDAIESDRCPQQLFVNMYPLLTKDDIQHIRKFVYIIQNSPRFFNLALLETEFRSGVVPYEDFKVIKGILLESKIIFREVNILDRKAINYATIYYIKFRDNVLEIIASCW